MSKARATVDTEPFGSVPPAGFVAGVDSFFMVGRPIPLPLCLHESMKFDGKTETQSEGGGDCFPQRMDNERSVRTWQEDIIAEAETKLERYLASERDRN